LQIAGNTKVKIPVLKYSYKLTVDEWPSHCHSMIEIVYQCSCREKYTFSYVFYNFWRNLQ